MLISESRPVQAPHTLKSKGVNIRIADLAATEPALGVTVWRRQRDHRTNHRAHQPDLGQRDFLKAQGVG